GGRVAVAAPHEHLRQRAAAAERPAQRLDGNRVARAELEAARGPGGGRGGGGWGRGRGRRGARGGGRGGHAREATAALGRLTPRRSPALEQTPVRDPRPALAAQPLRVADGEADHRAG